MPVKIAIPIVGLLLIAGIVFTVGVVIRSWWALPFGPFKVGAEQPIKFPHNLHAQPQRTVVDARDLTDPKTQIALEDARKIKNDIKVGNVIGAGIDCQFCHRLAQDTNTASLPAVQQCYFCHQVVATDKAEVTKIITAFESNQPINWVRVHRLPDHVHFVHDAHIRFFSEQNNVAPSQVCSICHGDVASMVIDQQVKALRMRDCVDCHRGGYFQYLTTDAEAAVKQAVESGKRASPPTDCAACHY